MKKIFSLFAAVLFCTSMFAANVYFVNSKGWEAVKVYMWQGDTKNADWPGVAMTKTEDKVLTFDVYSYDAPAGLTNIIFNNGSGTQTGDMIFDAAKPYFYENKWYATAAEIVPEAPAKYYITGDSALIVDAGLDKANAWNPAAIKAEKDTFVLNLKANQAYKLKITLDGTWASVKGFEDLTVKTGMSDLDGNDHNIGFTLQTAGDVKVIYNETEFKLLGDFVVIANGYYLVGTISEWKPVAANMFIPNNDVKGEYKLDITLAVDDEIKVVEYKDGNYTWYPTGDFNYKVDADHAGAKTVYFRPAGNEDWSAFGGYMYIEANEGTGISNNAVEAKAIKTIMNGQLVIIKGGKVFNATGAQIQ